MRWTCFHIVRNNACRASLTLAPVFLMDSRGLHKLTWLSWRTCRDQREPAHDNLPAPALPGALMEVDESHPGGGWPEDDMQGPGASTAPSNITAPETEIEGGAAAVEATAHAPASAAAAEEDGAEVQSHM